MCQIFIQEVTVLIFLGRRIEQPRTELQTELAYVLLHEIEMFFLVVEIFLESAHVVRFGHHHDYVYTEIPF
jgi:hypothetical protein